MSKANINLPKTAFSMKANLPNKEPDLVDYWDQIELYKNLRVKSKQKEKGREIPFSPGQIPGAVETYPR